MAQLKVRAAATGCAVEAEQREILRSAPGDDPRAEFFRLAALARAATVPCRHRRTPSGVLQRETREER